MINVKIRHLLNELLTTGQTVSQDTNSLFKSDSIIESLNTRFTLEDPRSRIFYSPSSLDMFNPGLAVARFFYLLSGSNLLKDISFYTKGVERFSDDGIHVSGSSYGHRIFSATGESSQFDRTIALLQKKRNTKRAAISIYNASDCGKKTKDIPCCMSLVLSPRDEFLHFTVHMRANNISTLTAYNVFEFSLLFEFIANLTGYKLGTYFHLSTSTHFPVAKLDSVKTTLKESLRERSLGAMPAVNSQTRENLVQLEIKFRNAFSEYLIKPDLQNLIDVSKDLTAGLDPYWSDFYFTITNYFLSKNASLNDCKVFSSHFIQETHTLLPLQLRWFEAAQSEQQ